ncbi:MAG: M24 family metallopeptidase [Candidatus Gastranaerophilales bacterium]|nr:M24 family metallopeptidase [Candidatus Gastranaerophilales bacterium]
MTKQKLIIELRSFMEKEGIDIFLVSSTDEYLNEYIDLKQNSRYLLTGFSGSTGDALVTRNNVFLFVDGRYHIQADQEVDKNIVTVVKLGLSESPRTALINKINELSESGSVVGFVNTKISYFSYKLFTEYLYEVKPVFREFNFDPVLMFSGVEESEAKEPLRYIGIEISGLTPLEKIDIILNEIKKLNIDALLVTKLEEIAYILNLRGKEIPCSSSFKAKAVIKNNKCLVFTDLNNLPACIEDRYDEKFEFLDIKLFDKEFENYTDAVIGFIPGSMNLHDYRLTEKNKSVQLETSPISKMKAIKNSAELDHMKECFRKSDIVINRAICWLNQGIEKGLKISEKDFAVRVKELFFEEGAYGLSFEVLAASGKNSAIIHYTNPDPEKFIQKGDIVLLDCGAYCEGGYATDTTRTFLAKDKHTIADEETKKIYTTVLKAFLHGLNYPLTENTSGYDIDKKVRKIINKDADVSFSFPHGTGHGVGLAVHESPPRLSPAEDAKKPLEFGMCFSIEPGLYKNEWGGVRLENTVTIEKENDKLIIRSLTRSKFDENLVDYDLLNDQEIGWLKNYQDNAIG